jgi:hypothetical protein
MTKFSRLKIGAGRIFRTQSLSSFGPHTILASPWEGHKPQSPCADGHASPRIHLLLHSTKMDPPAYPLPNPLFNTNDIMGDAVRPSSDLSTELSGPRSRSCAQCRSRKIKCDRQIPCNGCIRSGSQCAYPAGPGRAPKRPRRAVDSHVLDRLSRLEVILKQMGSDRGQNTTERPAFTQPEESSVQVGLASSKESSTVEKQLGRLVIDDKRSYYVSNKLWANLTNEVSRQYLVDMVPMYVV